MKILKKFVEINVKMIICSTSPPGGNQVDGLPPVLHFFDWLLLGHAAVNFDKNLAWPEEIC